MVQGLSIMFHNNRIPVVFDHTSCGDRYGVANFKGLESSVTGNISSYCTVIYYKYKILLSYQLMACLVKTFMILILLFILVITKCQSFEMPDSQT